MAPKIPKPVVPAGRQPVTPQPTAGKRPVTPRPARRCWSFSFRYWRQIENFGFDRLREVSDKWFVSLLERLMEMGSLAVDDVLESPDVQDALRFHAIDHEDDRTTMRRDEFDWVDRVYLEDEYYAFFQFHVSKALGRVIGFFDENKVFCVLLLDPHHNMQLSKFSGYTVRQCKLLESEHALLKSAIDKAVELLSRGDVDRARTTLMKAAIERTGPEREARAVITVAEADAEHVETVMRDRNVTLREIFETGLMTYLEKADKILEELADETADDSSSHCGADD